MKKKKIIIIVIIAIFVLMLIPIKDRLWDGGSTEYKAILYKYTKIHRISQTSSTGYEDGWELRILGFHVAGEINTYVEVLPKITIEELEDIHKEVDDSIEKYKENNEYHNVASTGVDREKYRLIIELVDNSTEQQKWFRDNIYDSKYIVFKQGGTYTTSSENNIKPNLFNRNEIIKVTIDNYSQYKNNFEYSDKNTIDTIYNLFKNLETNVESKSSEPENLEELYKVIFFNSENMLIESDNDIFKSTIYVYRQNNKYYAEETKNGIYEITEKTFNTIKNYAK